MDFFQHRAFLHARLPRVSCPTHGVRQVAVPWAREGSGFTLLFEALLPQFAAAMPVRTVAGMVGEHDTRIWRVLDHHVSAARACADHSQVTRVGIDETAAARGQDYVSIFADMDRRRVLLATEGRDGDTVARFAADLSAHGGDPAAVTDTSSDMSAAYIAGIGEHSPCEPALTLTQRKRRFCHRYIERPRRMRHLKVEQVTERLSKDVPAQFSCRSAGR